MPPRQKFTREEIVEAALAIARKEGMEAITARRLGAELGSSARPIFTVFTNMEEVMEATRQGARDFYNTYVQKGLQEEKSFKGVGQGYIRFAREEPKLFQLLFMKEQSREPAGIETVLSILDESNEEILAAVEKEYQLNEESAKELYLLVWIFTHGVAVLFATGVCSFTEAETEQMLTKACIGILMKLKKDERDIG